MSKQFPRRAKQIFIISSLCLSFLVATACVESSFELASESRLPKWITIPEGLTRADVSVTMKYYTSPLGRGAKFIAKDKNGKILTKVDGKQRGLYPLHLKTPPEGSEPGYPAYEIITVSGTTEIIEHKKLEPKFYVIDDPAVRKELLAMPGSNNSRQ